MTTEAKAKAMRGFVEKIITKSKKGTSSVQREVFKKIKNKDAVKALFSEISQKALERNGGYTRVIKLPPRLGDASKMAFIELVDFFANIEKKPVVKMQDRSKRLKGTKKTDDSTASPNDKKNKDATAISCPYRKESTLYEIPRIRDGGISSLVPLLHEINVVEIFCTVLNILISISKIFKIMIKVNINIVGLLTAFYLFVITGCGKKVNYEDFAKAEYQINEKQKLLFESSKEISEDLKEMMKRYPDKKIKFDTGLGLNADQESVLLDMIKNEKDPTFKGTLQEIVDKNKLVIELTEQIRKLEDKLPTFYVVKKGDSHRMIAINFLKDVYKLEQKKAEELVDRSGLYDELEVGFKVWLYYNDDVFGTFVTQGSAKVSPYKLKLSMRKSREEEIYREAYEKGRNDTSGSSNSELSETTK
ncbi:hypothetical protein CHS0354_023750 [Potamilus streckersoni]|uniref:Large ribosomal subunit protein bL17m n=1 Tax=Potamilus streckersoni TaxID=2493646 RepID=A0AAE0VMF4_9BIVA|nr:hypothetical protein CHS0354_023750 [Potamilus streckersoni]